MSEASGKDPGCVQPRRALVSPRVRAWPGGEALPLEMHVRELLEKKVRGPVNLFGGAGSGKKTALNHLVAVFGDAVCTVDGAPTADEARRSEDRLLVFATKARSTLGPRQFELEAWGDDDCIEYLLGTRREKCKSVMARILAAEGRDQLGGTAQLWVIALDEFSADEALVDIGEALRRHTRRVIDDPEQWRMAGRFYFQSTNGAGAAATIPEPLPFRLLRHAAIGIQLAADYLVERLAANDASLISRMMPRRLIQEAGRLLRGNPAAAALVPIQMRANADRQPMGASLMIAADPAWRPGDGEMTRLVEAELDRAQWAKLWLSGCEMERVHLARADLSGAKLMGSSLNGGRLHGANLREADMSDAWAMKADFSGADMARMDGTRIKLSGANLEGANLSGARLEGSDLDGANLTRARCELTSFRGTQLDRTVVEEADFSGADFCDSIMRGVGLCGATCTAAFFCRAFLISCNLEGMELPGADFSGANLTGSDLTGSAMPGANFCGAKLRRCGLAEVAWEGANLNGVDFRGATFHMGSTRSGLVNSVIASEGTRTGFYTDDYNEQDYKAPEEIRKANLCGCDLRDAIVELTDFYLVDLRGAKYSEEQGRHFARCGAILRARK